MACAGIPMEDKQMSGQKKKKTQRGKMFIIPPLDLPKKAFQPLWRQTKKTGCHSSQVHARPSPSTGSFSTKNLFPGVLHDPQWGIRVHFGSLIKSSIDHRPSSPGEWD